MNVVDATLAEEGTKLTGRERLTSVHANRFILFIAFRSIGQLRLNSGEDITILEGLARATAYKILPILNQQIAIDYPEAYPGNIFKNQERQTELLASLTKLGF
jgi:hypothetical protein